MQIEKIELGETGMFSPIFLDYINEQSNLKHFYGNFPRLEGYRKQIKEKQFSDEQRALLQNSLYGQYEGIELSEKLASNIESLKNKNTYTVTTGHQLNIFSGPLYFIFKIVTAINLAKKLSEEFPENNFVPVYWMATEDHDFEEINHFTLFGNKHTWETDQTGAVGRFDSESIKALLDSIPEDTGIFAEAYKKSKNLSEATRLFVNKLFGDQGLVIIDGDDRNLKASFADIIEDDLINHTASKMVTKVSQELIDAGYKDQAFPREINFFYLDEGVRSRIIKDGQNYKVKNTDLVFTESEILDLLKNEPEKFSPNVIMRPVFEERILPNLAYIGGPGELAYWLQLKEVFEHYSIAFPILTPRNFGMIVSKPVARKIAKLKLETKALFQDKQQLKDSLLKKSSGVDYELVEEKKKLAILYKQIRGKAKELDQTLVGLVGAKEAETLKIIEGIEKRFKRTQEQRQEIAINQLMSVKDSLFPGGGLQERKLNILNFSINNPSIYQQILDSLDPLDLKFHVLSENE